MWGGHGAKTFIHTCIHLYEYVGHSGKLKQVMVCSVGLHKEEELSALKKRMETAGMHTLDMTNNDLAKDHLRHLVSFSLKPARASLFTYFFLLCKNFSLQLFLWCRKTQIWNGFIVLQMGGQTQVDHELLYRFVFPERPGALMQFLEMFSPRWNITLFHYRSQVLC